MRLAVVVQRYGADISGGAELHARYVAEHLARHAEVEVFTTCARDYVTWANELPAGPEEVNGLTVHRFPVAQPRDVRVFARRSTRVFSETHSVRDEVQWLASEGPTSPALVHHLSTRRDTFDFAILFSYRYYHAWHGARALASKAVVVPTAERDAAIGVSIFAPVFRGVRALMFNSFEERAMIQHVAGGRLPGVVVGVGSEVPPNASPDRFRQRTGITGPFAIYVGRIDANKGCSELFDFFARYASASEGRPGVVPLQLVLVGTSILEVPRDRRIHHLGFVSDEEKFDAMAAASVLIMPSQYESLSMVTLEAWALGRPVLVNGRCDVLVGQCLRSNAGLWYTDYQEFAESLQAITTTPSLGQSLGANGRAYFNRHYTWPVVERKYMETLDRLAREPADRPPMPPLPGVFARRRHTLPPAEQVLAGIPSGPVRR